MSNRVYFIDFDGTITRRDSLDLLFAQFANRHWLEYDRRWERGEIGSRENLEWAFASFFLSYAQLDEIIAELTVDVMFNSFVKWASANDHECIIVSEGLDYIIENTLRTKALLTEEELSKITIHAGSLDGDCTVMYPPAQPCDLLAECRRCAVCKHALVRSSGSEYKVYIGDGLSDRFAIRPSNRIYAKNQLAHYCRAHGIRHVPFECFATIIAQERIEI